MKLMTHKIANVRLFGGSTSNAHALTRQGCMWRWHERALPQNSLPQ